MTKIDYSKYTVGSTPYPALLIFIDIIDSSVYSSILGITKFAQEVLRFRQLFDELGECYFSKPYLQKKDTASFYDITSRGDEGFIFIIDPEENGSSLVSKAMKFAFELKARLKILNQQDKDKPPTEMRVAIGIHYGEVAVIQSSHLIDGIYRNLIEEISGYSINYAKRVESISRIGCSSQVFLSKEAAKYIQYEPVVLSKYKAALKGIKDNDEVYEVTSAFFDNIPLYPEIHL